MLARSTGAERGIFLLCSKQRLDRRGAMGLGHGAAGRRWRWAEARIQGGGGAKADGIRVVLDAGRRRTLTNLPHDEAAMALLQVAAVSEAAKFREGE